MINSIFRLNGVIVHNQTLPGFLPVGFTYTFRDKGLHIHIIKSGRFDSDTNTATYVLM